MKRIASFLIVGGVGFVVDVGVLLSLMHFARMDAFSARLVAIACALFCTWMLNRNFTFDKGAHSLAKEGARYWSVGISSSLVNYFVYSVLLLIDRQFMPLAALMLSSGCATIFSYTGYSRFVFRHR
jgi:putative flippase GtrA